MSTIITPNTAYFKEGEVYVYTLPEELEPYKYCQEFNKKPCPLEAHGDICACMIAASEQVHDSLTVSYARAHPFKVDEKDKAEIKKLIWLKYIVKDKGTYLNRDWQPQDLTEYRIEGLKFEIKEEKIEVNKSPTGWQLYPIIQIETKQVACLIEDDGVKN